MKPSNSAETPVVVARDAWQAPAITRLPRLTELTLATGGGIPGGGGTGGGGSTVIP